MRDFNVDGELVGRPYQTVLEESLVQKYPIGMKYESWGKRWRYCRANEGITVSHRGAVNLATAPWTGTDTGFSIGSGGGGAGTITGAAGASKVLIASNQHVRTLDEFQGGIINAYPAATPNSIWEFRVIGNDLNHDGAAALVFWAYIDPPLPVAMAAVPMDMQPSPYMNTGMGGTTGTSVVCIPGLVITTGYFYWGQTKGPCFVSGNLSTTANVRQVGVNTAGGSIEHATVGKQSIGYIMALNTSDDDSIVMLMLE